MPKNYKPTYDGSTSAQDSQLTVDQKNFNRVASAVNPVVAIVDGCNAFYTQGLKNVMYAQRIPGKKVEGSKGRNVQYYIDVTGYGPGSFSSPHQAAQQKDTYLGKFDARLAMIVEDTVTGKVKTHYSSKSHHLMVCPIVTGTVLDPSAGDQDKLFDSGNCPYMPQGVVVIKGNTKHVLHQSKLRNVIMLYEGQNGEMTCNVTCTNTTGATTKILVFDGPEEKSPIQLHLPIFGVDGTKKMSISLFHALSVLYRIRTETDENGETFLVSDVGGTEEDSAAGYEIDSDFIRERILEFVPEEHRETVYTLMEDNVVTTADEVLTATRAKFQINSEIDLEDTIFSEVYPIIANDDDGLAKKAHMIEYMAAQFFMYKAGLRHPDDRNIPGFTRIETPEILMTKRVSTDLADVYSKLEIKEPPVGKPVSEYPQYLDNLASSIFANVKIIGEKLIKAYSKGEWTVRSAKGNASKGLSETVQAESVVKTISLLAKTSSASPTQGKQLKVRLYNRGQAGYNDPKDSHEGETIGLTRQLTYTCYISNNKNIDLVMDCLFGDLATEYAAPDISESRNDDAGFSHPLFVGNVIRGWCNGPDIVAYMREMRKKDMPLRPYFDMMVCFDEHLQEVQIACDAGRMTRPLFVANEDGSDVLIGNEHDLTFEEMLDKGYVEMVDAYDSDKHALIAMTRNYQQSRWKEINILEKTGKYEAGIAARLGMTNYEDVSTPLQGDALNVLVSKRRKQAKYTHVEIAAITGDGVAGSLVPGTDHNLGSKNAYACGIGKQTISAYQSNFRVIVSTIMKYSMNRTRPLMDTCTSRIIGTDKLPSGQNIKLAMIPGVGNSIYGGTNQEDAIEISQSLVDRGGFSYMVIHQVKYEHSESNKDVPDSVVIGLPDKRTEKHAKLDDRGIVKTNVKVQEGDTLISRKVRNPIDGTYFQDDIVLKNVVRGVIDDIIVIEDGGIYSHITVKIREFRRPIKGSKFSTRYGNKGVIGSVTATRNMPRDENGVCPDMTFNPLGYISRQTWSLLMEMISASGGASVGMRQNGTSFSKDFDIDDFIDVLRETGLGHKYNTVQMYDGRTGLPHAKLAYVGEVYMQLLVHTPEDKANFRGRAKVNLNGQSQKGKKNEGNIRFGEMEKNTEIATGAAAIHHGIFGYDNVPLAMGDGCGLIVPPGIDGTYVCSLCSSMKRKCTVYRVNFSGPQRHMLQQISTQNIALRHYPVPKRVYDNPL